jgi:hypothetical protein
MGTSWKPIQPTEIKDINIIREVIAQIRKPIPPEVYARLEERDRKLRKLIRTAQPDSAPQLCVFPFHGALLYQGRTGSGLPRNGCR